MLAHHRQRTIGLFLTGCLARPFTHCLAYKTADVPNRWYREQEQLSAMPWLQSTCQRLLRRRGKQLADQEVAVRILGQVDQVRHNFLCNGAAFSRAAELCDRLHKDPSFAYGFPICTIHVDIHLSHMNIVRIRAHSSPEVCSNNAHKRELCCTAPKTHADCREGHRRDFAKTPRSHVWIYT